MGTNGQDPIWRAVGAASQGTAHQKQGLPCQDAEDFRILPAGVFLAALADGAGSAEFSEEGARCAVEEALEVLASGLETALPESETGWIDLMAGAFRSAQAALQRMAVEMDIPLREFAATLACAAVVGEWLAVGQLGDGAVVAGDPAGGFFSITQAQRGEYANETFFLTQEDSLEQVEVHILHQPVQALALMSDGLTRLALKMPANEPHLPFFAPLFEFAATVEDEARAREQLCAFLASGRVCARTDDDKSLILAVSTAYRRPEENVDVRSDPESITTLAAPAGDGQEKGPVP
jgi:hypothetical protein